MLHEVNIIVLTTKQMVKVCERISGIIIRMCPLALSDMTLIMILVWVCVVRLITQNKKKILAPWEISLHPENFIFVKLMFLWRFWKPLALSCLATSLVLRSSMVHRLRHRRSQCTICDIRHESSLAIRSFHLTLRPPCHTRSAPPPSVILSPAIGRQLTKIATWPDFFNHTRCKTPLLTTQCSQAVTHATTHEFFWNGHQSAERIALKFCGA